MKITKDEIVFIKQLMDKFPPQTEFELIETPSNGIGTNLLLQFDTIIEGYSGTFTIAISGPEKW